MSNKQRRPQTILLESWFIFTPEWLVLAHPLMLLRGMQVLAGVRLSTHGVTQENLLRFLLKSFLFLC